MDIMTINQIVVNRNRLDAFPRITSITTNITDQIFHLIGILGFPLKG